MIDIHLLDRFKNDFLVFLQEKSEKKIDKDELYLTESQSIVNRLEKQFKNLNLSIELFIEAKNNSDELAMTAALLRISSFMSGVYGVFGRTVEDIDLFMRCTKDISFPEDYKIPEHYNFPLK